jgi:hypothetical protein
MVLSAFKARRNFPAYLSDKIIMTEDSGKVKGIFVHFAWRALDLF